jgi:hypothetical protein
MEDELQEEEGGDKGEWIGGGVVGGTITTFDRVR